jgi:hypothetical protein
MLRPGEPIEVHRESEGISVRPKLRTQSHLSLEALLWCAASARRSHYELPEHSSSLHSIMIYTILLAAGLSSCKS